MRHGEVSLRDLIRRGRIFPRPGIPIPRKRFVMTDLIYIAAGVAVMALYVLYAVVLRRV
jgi:hypothetical protein